MQKVRFFLFYTVFSAKKPLITRNEEKIKKTTCTRMKSQEKPLHVRPARKRDETKRMSGKETKNNMIRYKVRFPFLFRSFLSKQTAPCKMRKPLILNLQNPGKKGQIFIHFFPRFSQQTNNKKAKKKKSNF